MSYTSLKYHVTFSTKERRPWLTADVLPRLCEYLGGMVRQQGGHPIQINGIEDHVHLVLSIPATLAVAKAIGDLKSNSTNWIHQTFPQPNVFCWQKEYAAFTISPSVLPQVVGYVQGQQAHHRKNALSFRDELIWLLKNHGIEFDEKYIQ